MYEKQQDEVAKIKEFIARNIARASTTKRAQSRRRMLEKMELMSRPQSSEKSAAFSFQIERQSGNEVLNVTNLAIGYDEQVISKISTSALQEANILHFSDQMASENQPS